MVKDGRDRGCGHDLGGPYCVVETQMVIDNSVDMITTADRITLLIATGRNT